MNSSQNQTANSPASLAAASQAGVLPYRTAETIPLAEVVRPLGVRLVVRLMVASGGYLTLAGLGAFFGVLVKLYHPAGLTYVAQSFILLTGVLGLIGGMLMWHRSRSGLIMGWIYAGLWAVMGAAALWLLTSPHASDPFANVYWRILPASLIALVVLCAALMLRADTRAYFRGVQDGFLQWGTTVNPKYTCGSLKYTGFGLILLFVWLLWGDFVFTLLDGSVPGILPLKMKELGAGDFTITMLNKTIAYVISFLLAPVVSTASDRTRTRWGRRMPYLLWSTPFVGLFLVGIGLYEPLTHLFTGGAASVRIFGMTLSSTAVMLLVLGVLIVGWDLANIFVNTVYWYLFNDVVPPAFLSRFLSVFRIVGGFAGMAYSGLIFPYSMSHFRIVFVATGIAYAIGFLLMVIIVKEGTYPPADPMAPGQKNMFGKIAASIATYSRECFTHRIYWYFYIANTCTFMCWLAGGTFNTIRNVKVLDMSMADLGLMGVWTGGIGIILQYPAGWVADRWHPIRVYVFSHIWWMLGTIAQCAWVFVDFNKYHPKGNLHYMWAVSLIFMPLNLVANAAEMPMYMRVLPKDRYGQFCSANGMIRAFAMIFGSMASAWFIMALKPWLGEWRYTWTSVWTLLWQLPGAVLLVLMYREWKRLGGDQSYVPPVKKGDVPPDPQRGFEVVQAAKH